MITLYTLPSAFDLVSVSPFCTKLEVYLRMRGLAYRAVFGDPRTAPKKKMPYVEMDGRTLSDSQHVIDVLEREASEPLDSWLTDRQKAESHLLRRALEEGFYFVTFYTRWFDERAWATYAPVYYPYLPRGLGRPIMAMLKRGVKKTLAAQGTGRHTPEEIYELGRRDVDALATILADKPFLFGDRPCVADATAFGFVSSALDFPVETPVRRVIAAHEPLVRFHARIRETYLQGWKPVIRDGSRG